MSKIYCSALLVLLFASCFFDGEEKQTALEISEVPVTPFVYEQETLDLVAQRLHSVAAVKTGFSAERKAQMSPVLVDGVPVYASDVVISGTTAFIAYNTNGEVFRGALQVVENFIADSTDKKPPQVVKEFHIKGLEINSLLLDGGMLYFGGAGDPDFFKGRSVFGSLKVSSLNVEEFSAGLKSFGSYGVVAIEKLNNQILLGIGAKDGGLLVLNAKQDSVAFVSRADIRALVVDGSEYWALAGTTDAPGVHEGAFLYGNEKGMFKPAVSNIPNFVSNYHKADLIQVEGKFLVAALAGKGFAIYNQTDLSEPVWQLVNSEIVDLQVRANAIAYAGNHLFLANGELGVRIFKQTNSFTGMEDIGRIDFSGMKDSQGQHFSANGVIASGNRLLVAAGSGGLQLYDLNF